MNRTLLKMVSYSISNTIVKMGHQKVFKSIIYLSIRELPQKGATLKSGLPQKYKHKHGCCKGYINPSVCAL